MRLCSSDDVIKALERAGFRPGPASNHKKGSHRTYIREHPDGHKDITPVVLAKREIPRGTLRSILRLANLTEAEFEQYLR